MFDSVHTSQAPATAKPVSPAVTEIVPDKEPVSEIKQTGFLQPKLSVGAPDDPYEKEADAMADAVIRKPSQNFLQRKCAACDEEQKSIQAKPVTNSISSDHIARKISVENPGGLIPNPQRTGLVQTNGDTVFNYINELCPDTDWMMQAGRIELLDTSFCFPSEEQDDGTFKSPSELSAHPASCECLCETSMDPLDNIVIRISDTEDGRGSTDDTTTGTTIVVPSPNAAPSQVMGASGTMVDSPPFIILAHELCGHHLLNRHGNDDENMLNDRRGGHDPTINKENEIRGEHGLELRGTFRDPCCGLGDNSPAGMQGTTHPCGKKFEEGLTRHRRYAYECQHWRDEYNRLNGTSYTVADAIPIVTGEKVPAQWRIEVYFQKDAPQSWLTLQQSLTEEGRENLQTVQHLLTAHPDWQTQLAGNASTDRPAHDPEYNTRLANRRVLAIRDDLLTHGVTTDRMKTFDSDCAALQDGVHNCSDTIAEPRPNGLDRNVEVKIFAPEQLRSNNSSPGAGNNFIQRKCAHCEDEEKNNGQLQRKTFLQAKMEAGHGNVTPAVEQAINSSKGRGSAMDKETAAFMQDNFHADFSSVIIHTSSDAARLNDQLQARAFTTGNDIYFNRGEYAPGSDAGKHLLAHELTHVLQQRSVSPAIQKAGEESSRMEEKVHGVSQDATTQVWSGLVDRHEFVPPSGSVKRKEIGHVDNIRVEFDPVNCVINLPTRVKFIHPDEAANWPFCNADKNGPVPPRVTASVFNDIRSRFLREATSWLNGWFHLRISECKHDCAGKDIPIRATITEDSSNPTTTVIIANKRGRSCANAATIVIHAPGVNGDGVENSRLVHEAGHTVLGFGDEYPVNHGNTNIESVRRDDFSMAGATSSFGDWMLLHERHFAFIPAFMQQVLPGCKAELIRNSRPEVTLLLPVYLGGTSYGGGGLAVGGGFDLGLPLDLNRHVQVMLGARLHWLQGAGVPSTNAFLGGLRAGLLLSQNLSDGGFQLGAFGETGGGSFSAVDKLSAERAATGRFSALYYQLGGEIGYNWGAGSGPGSSAASITASFTYGETFNLSASEKNQFGEAEWYTIGVNFGFNWKP